MSKEDGFNFKDYAGLAAAIVSLIGVGASYFKDRKNAQYKADKEGELKRADHEHQKYMHEEELSEKKFKASFTLIEKYEHLLNSNELTDEEIEDVKSKIKELRNIQHNYIIRNEWNGQEI